MKKIPSKKAAKAPVLAMSVQPGAGMMRLLSQSELKQVGGSASGPSPRGPGH